MDIERYRRLRALRINGDDGGAHCGKDTKKKIEDSGGKIKFWKLRAVENNFCTRPFYPALYWIIIENIYLICKIIE